MTQPNDLPPLPEPSTWTTHHGQIKAHLPAKMTAYGLQCAEAAVERERARCADICHQVAEEELGRRQQYAASVARICRCRIQTNKD